MEDSKIIELFYRRSEQAIRELSRKYGAVCRRVAGNILNNDQDVEECINDAYLGAWNTIPPNAPDPLLTYVCRIVRNLAVKRYHHNTSAKRNSCYDIALEELEECLASSRTVEEELSAKELAQLLDHFLDTLGVEDRVMFLRRYWYSDSAADIGRRLGITDNNVYVRFARIRGRLRRGCFLPVSAFCRLPAGAA